MARHPDAATASGASSASPRTVGPFRAFGQRWRIGTPDRDLAALVEELYASMADEPAAEAPGGASQAWDTAAGDEPVVTYAVCPPTNGRPGAVHRDGTLLGQTSTPASTLELLVWAINRQVLATRQDRLVLHAAAADADGTAVVLPAPSGAGKSTLVTALLDRGLAYVTDEAVAVAPDRSIEGFAKPVSLSRGSWELLSHHAPSPVDARRPYLARRWHLAPQAIATVRRRSRLGVLVLPRRRPAGPARLQPVHPATAVGELAPCTFVPPDETIGLERVRRLAALVVDVPVYELVYTDPAQAAQQLTRMLDRLG